MPTYPYACTACDHRFEVVQSFSDAPLTVCPACQGRLRKVFTSVGIVFKGSGFYRTDSRAGNGGNGTAAAATNGKDRGENRASSTNGGSGTDGKASGGESGDKSSSAAKAGATAGSSTGTSGGGASGGSSAAKAG